MVGPSISVDLNAPVPVYRQIADSLRTLLVEGGLRPGETLPSVRRLALELGITFNTVAQAYRELADEGWLELKHGRRAVVIDRRMLAAPSRDRLADFRRQIRDLVARMRAEGSSAAQIAAELRLAIERLES